jgi:hypothetical protein
VVQFSVLIYKSTASKFFVADLWIDSGTILGCRFQNRQHQSFWLPISESAAIKFLAADFRINSDTVYGC